VKLAFLFPGQGSQHAGMGASLLADEAAAALADRCSDAAGIDLRHLLIEASDQELMLTTNAQPALLFMGVALAQLLSRRGIQPVALAGHSVGEYTALCVAGAMNPEDGVRLTVERAKAMAAASPPGKSSMLAVLGLSQDQVQEALNGLVDVWPANFNTPTQTVVGGTVEALAGAAERLREAGARRLLPLNVAAAFHTPLMAPAGAQFRPCLDAVDWQDPTVPVVANLNAEPYASPASIAPGLEQQLSSPVRWINCIQQLRDWGCDSFLELGPKRHLSSMLRELAPTVAAEALAEPAAVNQYAERHRP
jgi:[acyl-carrier-protein] S-malonyltransferase